LSRRSHFLLTVGAASPLLVLTLVTLSPSGLGPTSTAILLWALATFAAAEVTWRRSVQPVAELIRELDVADPPEISRCVRRAQREMERSESHRQRATQLVDDISTGLGEGLLVFDPDLTVRLANPRALHFLGVEHIDEGARLLDHVRDPDVVKAVRLAVDGQGGHRVVIENPRGIWEVRPFPVRHGGAVVLITEVGPVRRAAELRRRFVQDLSHELRSPLAVMRTAVEAVEDEVSEDFSSLMVRQVERITRLTDELYELASIEAGEMDLRPNSQSLFPVVRQVLCDLAAQAEHAGVSLAVRGPEDLRLVFDQRAMTRVLSNLVDNAIKYNRRGGTVEVIVREGRRFVQIEVADTGIGIPTSELGAVMQRFYRIDQARTPGEGGLGLGLAIVKHMVQQMGGKLALDSREHVGTRVTVSLPASDPNALDNQASGFSGGPSQDANPVD